jgi:cytochrome c oxidase assembly protein subunit 11
MASEKKNLRTALMCVAVVAGMVGLSFASVPLYRIFCQVTGLGGTPGVSAEAPAQATDIDFHVRFDANVSPKLGWAFKPVQHQIDLKLGEERLAFYEATNLTDKPITGTATFNVTPLKVGEYFVKIDCFCFTEQTLLPGETVQMPVSFYVDPAILDDPNANEVETITLSYTFFRQVEDDKNVSRLATPNKEIGG